VSGLLYLSWRHLVHHVRASVVLILCLATTIFLPLGTRLVTSDFERALVARADATPLVAGTRGNRFDLVLTSLWFRASAIPPLRHGDLERLRESPLDVVVPLSVRHTARGAPLVATAPEYFERRGLTPSEGELPLWIGECVLGSAVLVDELGADAVGRTLFSDARGTFDLAGAVPLELDVVGRLAPTNGPDDHAVFVSVETGWMLEGLLHGHGEPAGLAPDQLFGGDDDHLVVGPALVEHRRATDANRSDFHLHVDPGELPLTSALVFPASDKSRTMLTTRVNTEGELVVVEPREIVDELCGFVFRIRGFLDLFAFVLGGATLVLGALVIALSVRLRAGELRTLERIGGSQSVAVRLVAIEIALILAVAGALVALGLIGLRLWFPDLMELIP